MAQKNKRTCLISFLSNAAFISPLSNLTTLTCSLPDRSYVIIGKSRDLSLNFKQKNTDCCIYYIEYNCSKKIITQFKNSFMLYFGILNKFIKIFNKIDNCLIFHEGEIIITLLGRLLGKKVIWMLPSSYEKMTVHNHSWIASFLRYKVKLCYSLSNKMILYSENLVTEWNLEMWRYKIEFAHEHFIDFEKFSQSVDFSDRGNCIGYIGRLSHEKGIDNLLKAIKILQSDQKNTHFLIIGDGPLNNSLNCYAKDNELTDCIKFIDWVPHNQVPHFFNKLRFFILPSYTEGLPNVILESMACGTPVIVTPVGAIPDIIINGENGFILKDNTPECIARTISNAMDHPHLNEIARNAQNTVHTHFSLETSIEQFNHVMGKISDE